MKTALVTIILVLGIVAGIRAYENAMQKKDAETVNALLGLNEGSNPWDLP